MNGDSEHSNGDAMPDLVVVCRSTPGFVDHLMEAMYEAKLDPVVLDRPNRISMWTSMGTYRIRIAVPREEAQKAHEIVTREQAASDKRVQSLGKAADRALLNVFLTYAGICLLYYIYYRKWEMVFFGWSFLWTFLVLIGYRILYERRKTMSHSRRYWDRNDRS